MQLRRLGESELKVSEVSMGCWGIGGGDVWGNQEKQDALEAIRVALDSGINFFDTAEAYGDGASEELVGKALEGRRDEAIIGTKVSPDNLAPADLRKSCEDSLRRLKTDYIDVYYIHWPNRKIPLEDTLGEMEKLKEEGKIRTIACSNFGVEDLQELLEHGRVEANQLPYSLLWRAIEHELQPLCVENNIGITAYSPLVHGLLTGKFDGPDDVPAGRARTRHFSSNRPKARHGVEGAEEKTFNTIEQIETISREAGLDITKVAISWVSSQKGVSSVVVGARNPEQVKNNVKGAQLSLTSDIKERLAEVTRELKRQFGKDPDMWNAPEESRYR